jgi:hypothetical protein
MADERLDEIEHEIEQARTRAQDAGIIEEPDDADAPKFYETGAHSDHDDQTITPPG